MFSLRMSTPILGLALLAAGGALLVGCESSPSRSDYANPFDPAGELGGDGLQALAVVVDSAIVISWTHFEDMGIETYAVDHSFQPDQGYAELVSGLVAPTNTYTHQNPDPNRNHYYLVQAVGDGDFSITGYATPGIAVMPPAVIPVPRGDAVATRFLDLKIVVGQGDSLRVADNASFTDADTSLAAAPGDTAVVAWDLGARAQGDPLAVYVESFGTGYQSQTAELTFTVDFAPAFTVRDAGPSNTVSTRVVDLDVPSTGVLQMRFAPTVAELAGATWVPGADTYPGYVLTDQASPDSVWGQFEGDFGFTADVGIRVRPALLNDATFALDVPASRVVDHPDVRTINNATATLMRFAESLDFAAVPWEAFVDTGSFTLSAGEGRKVVYAQYRNDWSDSPVLTDWVDLVNQVVSVGFLVPSPGAAIPGGTILQVRGTATPASGVSLSGVSLDLDDGTGFQDLTTAESWSTMWDVPVFTEATELILRARAYAGGDSATATVTVTVTP